MYDFFKISTRNPKKGIFEIYPKFVAHTSPDLMIRGGDFYAIWDEDEQKWSTDENDAIRIIDNELDKYYKEHRDDMDGKVKVLHLWDTDSGQIDKWHKYVQKQLRDHYIPLDEKLVWADTPPDRENYASKSLPYSVAEGDISSYQELMSTLYTEESIHKIEWFIGSIVSGASVKLDKMLVLYGSSGTGKSTVIKIVQKLFSGYTSEFSAKDLGAANKSFALEPFTTNPLVAIEHDADLSRIEDNTRLNSIVSHEPMMVNEKFKKAYSASFKCVLILGTNKPVRITDAKSGLVRRLIDVSPTGNLVTQKRYDEIFEDIKFELGAIAYHCREVYLADPQYYTGYLPTNMMTATNDIYSFLMYKFDMFDRDDGTTLSAAYEAFKDYCEMANVQYCAPMRIFGEELKEYFEEFSERKRMDNGERVRNVYSGFKREKFIHTDKPEQRKKKQNDIPEVPTIDGMCVQHSLFDDIFADCKAQYASEKGTPLKAWDDVVTTLKDLDTTKEHYVLLPDDKGVVVIDFDKKDKEGNKSRELNMAAASKWPSTYTEFSKSGAGIHLTYFYTGDLSTVSRIFEPDVEVKVFTGKASLRRRLSECNNIPIATLSSGLPQKEVKGKVYNKDIVVTEKSIRKAIIDNLNYKVWANTAPSVSMIKKILDDAYESGVAYDVSDLSTDVFEFASRSHHQANRCMDMVAEMHFKSDITPDIKDSYNNDELIFFDVEVYPNLFLIVWKEKGEDKPFHRMFNPTPMEVESLLQRKLVGFNCTRYDNHMLHECLIGGTNMDIYNRSQAIIAKLPGAMNYNATRYSYTDVYDFASAGHKKSLKKWEIELHIHHQEMEIPWDQPAPKELWDKIAGYCENDVRATEAVFNHIIGDYNARVMLSKLTGLTPNDSTNTHTTQLIFKGAKNPEKDSVYRNLAEPVYSMPPAQMAFLKEHYPEMMAEPFGEAKSLLPYWEGYEYVNGKSTYHGYELGEGGLVLAEPGMYHNVLAFDVESMHPNSAGTEYILGPYAENYYSLLTIRLMLKHGQIEEVKQAYPELAPYLNDEDSIGDVVNALKTAINSVYGLTSAHFANPFKNPKNVDNIVAKRGALFMVDLWEAVIARGGHPVHIKTDCIKVVDPTPELCDFIIAYGKRYGYNFEIEHRFEKFLLVNKAVYIGRLAEDDKEYLKKPQKYPNRWCAVGTQFQIPYVFKTLFSHEDISFYDKCETMSVSTAIYLDLNEGLPDGASLEKELTDRIYNRELEQMKNDPLTAESYAKKRFRKLNPEYEPLADSHIQKLIDESHNYQFVGKVGSMCPVKPGSGGGVMVAERVKKGRKVYDAVAGSKGYLWMESEMVSKLHKEDCIDESYYTALVDEAIATISEFGDSEWFLAS